MIIEINGIEEFESLIKSGKPVLADFWAEWCGPCKMLSQIIDEVDKENSDNLVIAKINVDENFELSQKYLVRSIPMLVVFNNEGFLVDKRVGFLPKKTIDDFISKVL